MDFHANTTFSISLRDFLLLLLYGGCCLVLRRRRVARGRRADTNSNTRRYTYIQTCHLVMSNAGVIKEVATVAQEVAC